VKRFTKVIVANVRTAARTFMGTSVENAQSSPVTCLDLSTAVRTERFGINHARNANAQTKSAMITAEPFWLTSKGG